MIEPLRARIRRLQLIMGLGFVALVVGSLFTSSFAPRLAARIQDLPELPRELIIVVLQNLWVLGALPLLAYGAARVLELRPLPTSLGAASTGAVFLGMISFVQHGAEGLWSGWLPAVLQAAALSAGVFLSHRAVVKARAAAARSSAQAQAQAEAKKVEYLEFLREAERGGEKIAQREAERAAEAASAGGAGVAAAAAPASEPAPASSDTTGAGASAETKAPTTGG